MTDLELYFIYQCEKGLKKRGLDHLPLYQERLKYEIDTIVKMAFCGYFLVVADLFSWARANKIYYNFGRGSAAGCLVSYALKITHVDPIKYGLIFERFLNPSRVTYPDIDMDFAEDQRELVLNYAKQKYRDECVANIGTFGSMKAKGSIRDVARTLGYSYEVGDRLAKLTLPPIEGKPQSLSVCYEKVPELKQYKESKGEEAIVLQWAERVEDRLRSYGTHASGVIIAPEPVYNYAPLYPGKDKAIATQFEMGNVEEVGLIKFDFLGLRTLTTVRKCIEYIKQSRKIDIDIFSIPIDDTRTYELLCAGDTEGLFQVEGGQGIRDFLVQVRPKTIEDISIILATYRPGPLGCLAGDTKILTSINSGQQRRNFGYKTIKQLYSSYNKKEQGKATHCANVIYSVNRDTFKLQKNKIEKVYYSGIKKVYKIRIQTGLDKTQRNYIPSKNHPQRKTENIKATEDHRFYTLNGWKTLGELKEGDYIAVNYHSCFGVKRSKKNIYGKKNFRNIAFRYYQYKCVFCNWDQGSLDVNHLENNRKINNSPENLSFLCPNHHRMYSEGKISKEELIQKRIKYTLPYTENMMYVRYIGKEYCGEEPTYDISVCGPHHNFLAGDFMVHNSDMLDKFLKVRAGLDTPEYLIPELEPILSVTSGMLIYQEQIIEICKQLAGFSAAEADVVRKTVGKKKAKEMEAQRTGFVSGMVDKGFRQEDAEKLFNDIEHFASYGFCKSHSLAYSYLTYTTAYLKAHYLPEFMCACLVSDSDEQDKIIRYLGSCKQHDIKILQPDINTSYEDFTVENNNSIRFGLSAIKNLGKKPVRLIMRERKYRGPFKDLLDFTKRVDISIINKKKLESLVAAGAFDSVRTTSRASLLRAIEDIWEYRELYSRYESKLETYNKHIEKYAAREKEIKNGSKKKSLKLPEQPEEPQQPRFKRVQELRQQELLAQEKELTGYFISGHPLDLIEEHSPKSIADLKEITQDRYIAKTIAVCVALKEITTKKNKQRMAYITLEDKTGTIEAVIFPAAYESYKHLLSPVYPASYQLEVEVVEGDTNNIVKAKVLAITMLNSVRKLLVVPPKEMSTNVDNALETANRLNTTASGVLVDFKVESTNNIWKFGKYYYN